MRLPVRSEPDAFRLAYGFALVTGISVLVGTAIAPLAGAVLFTAVAVAALLWDLTTEDPDRRRPLLEAEHEPHPEAGARRHVLVIANEVLEGDRLREAIRERAGPETELAIHAPVLMSRAHWAVSDVDREREDAQRRLAASLRWATGRGFSARGEVGDHNAPLASIEDELRRYGADEVLVATHPAGRDNWLEADMLERIRDELDVPVTHVIVDRERHDVRVEPVA